MRFRSTVERGGTTTTAIPVPEQVVESLGSGRRPAVRVQIGEYRYRSTVAVRHGVFLLPLSAEHRQAAGVQAGDEVEVELELDTEPREVAVPDDLARAIAGDEQARQRFDALPYSHQRQWVLSVDDAKSPETRRRRIDKAVSTLRSEAGPRSSG